MKDNDAFNLLGSRLAGRVLLIFVLALTFAAVGGFDYADQLAAEAKAKQERAARIAAYVDWHRDRPIRISDVCGATMSQGMTSVTMSEPRCVRVVEEKR